GFVGQAAFEPDIFHGRADDDQTIAAWYEIISAFVQTGYERSLRQLVGDHLSANRRQRQGDSQRFQQLAGPGPRRQANCVGADASRVGSLQSSDSRAGFDQPQGVGAGMQLDSQFFGCQLERVQ